MIALWEKFVAWENHLVDLTTCKWGLMKSLVSLWSSMLKTKQFREKSELSSKLKTRRINDFVLCRAKLLWSARALRFVFFLLCEIVIAKNWFMLQIVRLLWGEFTQMNCALIQSSYYKHCFVHFNGFYFVSLAIIFILFGILLETFFDLFYVNVMIFIKLIIK